MADGPSLKLPEYEKPPVTEVVCGVMFTPLKALLAPHLGLLWERYKPEYSECREVAPLALPVEGSGGAQTEIELLEILPLPRVWFLEPNGNKLIQVQRERFHHNWRKINPGDEYPRHKRVFQLFRERLETFREFLDEHKLGELEPKQFELTYVNHIPLGEGWDSFADIGKVFPDFAWNAARERFQKAPEGFHWNTAFALPEQAGRLHVTMRTGNRQPENQPIVLLDLTARGIGEKTNFDAMWSWFGMAHEHIVLTFADLADVNFQRTVWGRTT